MPLGDMTVLWKQKCSQISYSFWSLSSFRGLVWWERAGELMKVLITVTKLLVILKYSESWRSCWKEQRRGQISFENSPWTRLSSTCVCMLVAQLCLTLCNPMDCSSPGSLSMGFSRQEYWSGLPFLSPGDPPNPGVIPRSPTLQAYSSPSETPGKPLVYIGIPFWECRFCSSCLGYSLDKMLKLLVWRQCIAKDKETVIGPLLPEQR